MTATAPIELRGVLDRPAPDRARLRRLVDAGLREVVGEVPGELRALCGEALGVTDLEGRPRDGGGKRLRPVLCLAMCEAHGGPADGALTAALALECVHAFSLVHDDIVDGDRERRGRPSLWAAVGTRLALNAGDALHALSSSLACQSGPWVAPLIYCATMSMIRGQHIDLSSEGSPAPSVAGWTRLASHKTGALFAAAAAAGAAVAEAPEELVQRFWRLGELLGLAFQARDDLLGVWGDPAVTGKPAASDLERRVSCLVVSCGVERGGEAGEELRRALGSPETPIPALLGLLDACDARRHTEQVERGLLDELELLAAAPEVPGPAGAAFLSFAGSLVGRRA